MVLVKTNLGEPLVFDAANIDQYNLGVRIEVGYGGITLLALARRRTMIAE